MNTSATGTNTVGNLGGKATGRAPKSAKQLSNCVEQLKFRDLTRNWWAQSPAFWFTTAFLFIEYVRPQQIYPALAEIPWGKISLGGAFLFTLLEGRLTFRERSIWILLTAFTLIIVASSAQAYYPQYSFDNFTLWIIWLLAILVVSTSTTTKPQLVLTFLLWFLWNFKMSQSAFRSWMLDGFRFRDWGVAGAPGWFGNSGEFGIEMCVFFPIVGYFTIGIWPQLTRYKKLALATVTLTALIGIIASSSRGALLGLAAVGLWIMLRSPHRVRASLLVIVLASLSWLILPPESKDRWRQAGDDKTSQQRITYWKDGLAITARNPVLGIGYKNWLPYYHANFNPRGELPHNLFIECMTELGYSGLFVFLMMIGWTFWQNGQSRKRFAKNARAPDRLGYYLTYGLDGALIGYLVSGFFITVFFYPYFWINLAFTIALSRYQPTPEAVQNVSRSGPKMGWPTRYRGKRRVKR